MSLNPLEVGSDCNQELLVLKLKCPQLVSIPLKSGLIVTLDLTKLSAGNSVSIPLKSGLIVTSCF